MYKVKKSCQYNLSRKIVKKCRNIEHKKSEHVGRKSEYVLPEGFVNCFGVWKSKIRGKVPVYESVVERLSDPGKNRVLKESTHYKTA